MKPIKLTTTVIDEACAAIRKYLESATLVTGKVEVPLPTHSVCAPEDKPTIVFTKEAEDKIKTLVRLCSTEIGWHGTVEHTPGTNTYTIVDILLFPQTITGTTVNSIDDLYGPWLMDLDDDTFNTLRFHGHSHVNMGVFASGTDTNHQETLIESIRDYYIFMITNKKSDVLMFLYDKANNVLYEHADLNILYAVDETEDWAKENMEQYLEKPAPVVTTITSKSKDGYHTGVYGTVNTAQKQLTAYEQYLKDRGENLMRTRYYGGRYEY